MYQSQGEFDELAQTIKTNIFKTSQNVNSMQQMIRQLQSAPSSDNDAIQQKLLNMQNYTSQLVKDTNSMLKELATKCAGSPKNKVCKDRLANDFSDALTAFQSIQYKEVDQGRAEVQRARASSQRANLIELAGQLPAPPGSRAAATQDQYRQQQQQMQAAGGYQQTLLMDEEANLEIVRKHEEAVRVLEQNIHDVNGIFKEIATLIHEQAETVDSIEANVDSATIRVTEGAEQLGQARQHYESARRKQLCLVASGIIGLALLIVIIYFSVRN